MLAVSIDAAGVGLLAAEGGGSSSAIGLALITFGVLMGLLLLTLSFNRDR